VLVDAHLRPAGLVLLAVCDERAWIGGIGIVPKLRGHGWGSYLLAEALATLQCPIIARQVEMRLDLS
jgi:hypothetical protein